MRKQITAILLGILTVPLVAYAAGRLQNEDVKDLATLTGAGGVMSQLINDTKIYATGQSKQLSTAISDGSIISGALSNSTPADVGATGATGSSVLAARSDHVHKGVRSFGPSGGTALFGDVTISAGTNITLTPTGNNIEIAATGASGGGSGGAVTFLQSGGTSVMQDFGGPYVFANAATLASVQVGMYDSGSSGSTVFQVNQYRSGALVTSTTGTITATGLYYAGTITLGSTLNILTGDMITLDVNSVAAGTPQDLSVVINSGNLTGGIGPTGPSMTPVIQVKSANYTVDQADDELIATATLSFQLPDCTGLANNHNWNISNMSASGIVTVLRGGSNTFTDGPTSGATSYQLTDPGASITIICNKGGTLYVRQ